MANENKPCDEKQVDALPTFDDLSVYKAKQPITLTGGFVGFEKDEHTTRFGACVKETDEDGVYQIIKPFQIKAGHVFGYSGDLPKSTVALLDDMDADSNENNSNKLDEKRIVDIVIAISDLDPDSEDDFTNNGIPQVKALEDALGFDITAAERDAAWKKSKEA